MEVTIKTNLFEGISVPVLAKLLELDQSYVWRVKTGERGVQSKFIASALVAFPKLKFEDMFYIEVDK